MSTIATIFNATPQVEAAIADLNAHGIDRSQLSLLVTESARGHHFHVTEGNRAGEGVVGGAMAGGLLGGLVATLAALGVLAVPGVGLVAAGPILAALAGVGAGGAAGTLLGGLIGMGIPEHYAKALSHEIQRGGTLLAVEPKNPAEGQKIREILDRHTGSKMSKVGS